MLAAALLLAAPAAAQTCVTITGRVRFVDDRLGLLGQSVQTGDLARGHWRYRDGLAGRPTTPGTVAYSADVPGEADLEIRAGALAARADVSLDAVVTDAPTDRLALESAWAMSTAPGMTTTLAVRLADATGTALNSTALPVGAPDLARWGSATVTIDGCIPPACTDPAWTVVVDLTAAWDCRPDTPLLRGEGKAALPLDTTADRWLDPVVPGDVDAMPARGPLTVYASDGLLVRAGSAVMLE